jgi:hypothetical protein
MVNRDRLKTLSWIPVAAAVVLIDLTTDPQISFSQFYIFPVGMAAWYSGRAPALVLSVVFIAARWVLVSTAGISSPQNSIINALIRLIVLWSFALLVARVRRAFRLERDLKVLQGLLPICSYCNRIRDQHSAWQSFETYISSRSEADFTHEVCAECAAKHYKESFDRR